MVTRRLRWFAAIDAMLAVVLVAGCTTSIRFFALKTFTSAETRRTTIGAFASVRV